MHKTRWLTAAVVAGFLLSASAAALADDTVQMRVLGIQATTTNSTVSPELKTIAAELTSRFKYTGFRLIARDSGAAKLNGAFSAKLTPTKYEIKLTPMARESGKIKLAIAVDEVAGAKRESKLRTTVRVTPNKTALVGGWKISGNDVLIVAITAR